MRKESSSYGKWYGIKLSEENNFQLFIPIGFAHGYYVLSDYADVIYKCSEIYYPEYERGIIWNDPFVNIHWPCKKPILSEKDKNWPLFNK